MLWSIIPADVVFNGFIQPETTAEAEAAEAVSPEACRSFNPKYFLRK